MAVQQRQQGESAYSASVSFLENLDVSVQKLGLERVRMILDSLGNPQDKLPMVHVTGTNGKGSVSAMLASVLAAADLNVGMFTSPHLVDMRERIVLNEQLIPEADFAEGFVILKSHLEQMALPRDEWPTYFEWLNIQAYLYFAKQKADITVFEVGLGGRLDSTNVVSAPNVTVITGIGLDHAHILGDTVEKIAAEKAGILKPGVPLVLGPSIKGPVKDVILARAAELNVPVTQATLESFSILPESSLEEGLMVSDTLRKLRYRLSLRAPYQIENMATALTVLDVLKKQGWAISSSAIQTGLAQVKWPARFQVLPQQHLIIDGSHNKQGFESLRQAVHVYLAEAPVYWLVSLQQNRPLEALVECIRQTPGTRGVIWTTAVDEEARYHEPEAAVAMSQKQLGEQIPILALPLPEAFQQLQRFVAQTPGAYGIATGSLYTAGDLLALLFLQ